MQTTVAALFVETHGAYFIPGVDPWDKIRDARLYSGPYVCVAHPPCQLWGNLAGLNYSRWGGEHNRPGNDAGCFESALTSVRRWGGVLEHPAMSKAWAKYGLLKPKHLGWNQMSGAQWTCEVWQSAYGHRARKRTWLYYCGERPPFELNWARLAGEAQIGIGWNPKKPVLSKREANATPIAFRDCLLALARQACPDQ